jgi:hypothetical protein
MIRATGPGWRLLLLPAIPYLLSFAIPVVTPESMEFGAVVFQNQLYLLCHPMALSDDSGKLMAAMTWLANPLLWLGYFAMAFGRYAVAIIFGLGATFLAMLPPVFTYFSGKNVFPEMPYCWWAWQASMILLVIASELAYDLSPERAELERQWARDRTKEPPGSTRPHRLRTRASSGLRPS